MNSRPRYDNWCAVIPAFTEAARVGWVVRGVREQGLRVIVVDDGSEDETARCAAEAGAEVIRHATNQGKGAALQTGFCIANEWGVDWVVTLDADGQHDPADLAGFLREAERGAFAVLIGNRMHDVHAMPRLRRLTNRIMSAWLSHLIGQPVPDSQCGYRAYRRDALEHVAGESAHFEAESEALIRLARAGYQIGAVPIRTIYHAERSKIRPVRDAIRFLRMLHRCRRFPTSAKTF